MVKIAAIILAAGLSQRMGQPKMLLPWGETTVIGQVIATFSQAGASQVFVVSGGAHEAVHAKVELLANNFPVSCVRNPLYANGEMLTSLQTGLAVLDSQVEACLIGLGDQPQLSLQAIQMVISSFMPTKSRQIIVPSHNMRRGHPWLVQKDLWALLMALKPPQTLRDFLNACDADLKYVETDPTVLKDLDTPEEYAREKP